GRPAGGEAGPGGGALLRHRGACDRLRRLASGPRGGDGRAGGGDDAEERLDREGGHAQRHPGLRPDPRAHLQLRAGAGQRGDDRSGADSAGGPRAVGPASGRQVQGMSLLVVGSVALDSVETPFGRRDDVLGGSATYFAAAASLLTRVSVVGVVGEDFPLGELDFLRKRGVELGGRSAVKGKTFRWRGRYGFDLNAAETLDTQLNVFEQFSPELGPAARKAERIFLGNINPELQMRVLDQAERPRLVCADTMNYWISS